MVELRKHTKVSELWIKECHEILSKTKWRSAGNRLGEDQEQLKTKKTKQKRNLFSRYNSVFSMVCFSIKTFSSCMRSGGEPLHWVSILMKQIKTARINNINFLLFLSKISHSESWESLPCARHIITNKKSMLQFLNPCYVMLQNISHSVLRQAATHISPKLTVELKNIIDIDIMFECRVVCLSVCLFVKKTPIIKAWCRNFLWTIVEGYSFTII